MNNGTEFKNKLWTDVFNKLKIEQKFTPIYSLQCNGRIEGFHKFLKATIAKQLETHVKWDDLVWKATAAYNFFPTESSRVAPFFLMFGCKAAVKHTPLESERPKYLGTDDGMINVELMSKLYMVIAHNLREASKARDGNRKVKMIKETDKLKIGDNVLVRDHTSKAFQPKYRDFCIIGLLGKNQIEIKDNHGHTTKVHQRDVKKIPMTEKICQLYEEEQIGKLREGGKTVPNSKMPDLGWDIAETQLQKNSKSEEVQENSEVNTPWTASSLQATITITILIITILELLISYIQEIPKIMRKIAQTVKYTITGLNDTKVIRNVKKTYKEVEQRIMIASRAINHTNQGDHGN